jgi:hypothetical protein
VAGNGRLMRAAGIETFGGEVQMLELPAPQSLAADEVVIAVRAAGVGNWDEIIPVGGWDVAAETRMATARCAARAYDPRSSEPEIARPLGIGAPEPWVRGRPGTASFP